MTRVIFYYQTFETSDNKFISLDPILYENTPVTHIHVSSIHFGIDSNKEPYIHLNNKSPYNEVFDNVWDTLNVAAGKNISVIAMIGGAGGGYSSLFSNFDMFYDLLYNFLKNKPFISGIDLDIEEEVDINNVKKLINKIINDFGEDYIITTAPVLSSLISDTPGMGGFCYKTLLNSKEGSYIKYINCQAYYNYTLSSLQKIVENGYNVNQIVMGMIAGESYSDELLKMVQTYGSQLGGIFVWEYFNTQPSPQEWLSQVGNILNKTTVSDFCTIS